MPGVMVSRDSMTPGYPALTTAKPYLKKYTKPHHERHEPH